MAMQGLLLIMFLAAPFRSWGISVPWGPQCPSPGYPGPHAVESYFGPIITADQIKFRILTTKNISTDLTVNTDWKTLNCIRVCFIFHGTAENSSKPWVTAMQEAFVSKYNTCAVAVDYTYAAYTFYPASLIRGDDKVIAATVANMINKKLRPKGLNITQHCMFVGFSYGAQLAGITANKLKPMGEVYAVVGLEPATGYEFRLPSDRLSPGCAQNVVTFHTSVSIYSGPPYIYGKTEYFFGQCGSNQYPECKGNDTCDHVTSHDYYIARLNDPTLYRAYKCHSCPYPAPNIAISNAVLTEHVCNLNPVPIAQPFESSSKLSAYILPNVCVPPNK